MYVASSRIFSGSKYKSFCVQLFISFCLLQQPIYTQDVLIPFERFGESKGLPAPVYKIAQDHFGYIWLGTSDGLARFDGKNFKLYNSKLGDSTSIPNNIINDLIVDTYNRIWIATNGGICYYDYEIARFVRIKLPQTLEKSDLYRVHCIRMDAFGRIWFATKTAVHRLGDSFDVEASYHPSEKNNLVIKSIYLDINENLFIGTNQSEVIQYNLCTDVQKSVNIASRHSKEIRSTTTQRLLVKFNDSSLLVGSWLGGLNQLNYSDVKLKAIHLDAKQDIDIKSNIVTGIVIQNDSCWWIGTFGAGISFYNPKTSRYYRSIKHDPGNGYSLSSNYIHELFKDEAGAIWVATQDGVNKYDPRSHQFSTIQIPLQNNEISIYRNPYSIVANLQDIPERSLLISIPGLGILNFNKQTREFKQVLSKYIGPNGIFGNKIYQLEFINKNELLILESSRLLKYDFRNQSMVVLNSSKSCKFENARKLKIDKNKNYWISSSTSGVYKLDSSFEFCNHLLSNPDTTNSLQDNAIFCILEDHKGTIWFGSQNSGLSKYDAKDVRFTYYKHDKNNPQSLPDNAVYDLYEDNLNFIWIATENGLARLDPSNQKMKIITISEGLPNNNISSITPDRHQNLWLTTNQGVAVLNGSNGSIQVYVQMDGLATNRMDGASYTGTDGSIYFSTNSMMSWSQTGQFIKNTIPPKVYISNVKVYGEDVPSQRIKNKLKPIHINYRQNIFTAEFAALSFTNSTKNKFAYTLEGYDNGFIYSGNNSIANYSNIPGGTYTFKVKAANNDGIWSTVIDPLELIVHPPFWKTAWFLALCCILIVGLGYSYYKIKIQQIIKLQQLRNSIARDLHDEIGSTLSSIQLNSNLLEKQLQQNTQQVSLLNRIQSASKQAIEMMNEIIWSVQPKNDALDMLFIRMRQYASEILEAAEIAFKFEVLEFTSNVDLPLDKRKDLLMIFKEAINNLAKYSSASLAHIEISVNKKQFELTIADNGLGFNSLEPTTGNGIKNMKDRSDRLHAKISIESIPGHGTSIKLTIPLIT